MRSVGASLSSRCSDDEGEDGDDDECAYLAAHVRGAYDYATTAAEAVQILSIDPAITDFDNAAQHEFERVNVVKVGDSKMLDASPYLTIGGVANNDKFLGGPIWARSVVQSLANDSSYEAEIEALHMSRDLISDFRSPMPSCGFDHLTLSVDRQDNMATLRAVEQTKPSEPKVLLDTRLKSCLAPPPTTLIASY
jgi:hypothetical protein